MPPKKKAGSGKDGAAATSARGSSRGQQQQQQQSRPHHPRRPPVPASHGLRILFASLRGASDLPAAYAALKLLRDRVRGLDRGYVMTPGESDLYEKACLAVPYLMYKKAVDLLMRPRSMGGLAFAASKAEATVRGIFEAVGVAACGSKMTEKKLLRSCPGAVSTAADARKILTKLAEVGSEARSRVAELSASVAEGASKSAMAAVTAAAEAADAAASAAAAAAATEASATAVASV
jgi:hypothetical protein